MENRVISVLVYNVCTLYTRGLASPTHFFIREKWFLGVIEVAEHVYDGFQA